MNREELEEYINAYGKEVYSFCCFLTKNRICADDLYQDTFLKLYESKDTTLLYNARSYIMSIAVNLYRNQKRKEFIRQRIIGTDISEEDSIEQIADTECSIEGQIIQKEATEAVRNIVRELSDKYRIPLLLFYMEEMSIANISAILKLSEGTIKSRIHRGKKIIRQKMEAMFYEK